MTPDQFKAWRANRRWSQIQAAEALGISEGSVMNYERGVVRGTDRPAPVPRAVALACAALALGLRDYPS